jgi:Flp pilus assembly protein TadD
MACSSADKKKEAEGETVKNEVFKKEKPLKNTDVKDYYASQQASLNPALQDETLDRSSVEEIEQMAEGGDPLVEMALRCSKGDFKNAFALASKIFDKYQKVASYWNQVGNCHLNQGANRKALLFYNKALEVKSNYVPALNNIGVMYSRQGQDQKALVAFERANKVSKFSKTPRYNLAKLYLAYGMAEQARPIFQALLNESPQDVDLLNAVASCQFLMSDYQSALGYFKRIPEEQWANPEIGLNLAVTLKKVGKADDARKVFDYVKKPKQTQLAQYYSVVEKHLGESR